MSNTCYTELRFVGDAAPITEFHNIIESACQMDVHHMWVENLIEASNLQSVLGNEDLFLSASFSGFPGEIITTENDQKSFKVSVESDWSPCIKIFRRVIEEKGWEDSIHIFFISEEMSNDFYASNDESFFGSGYVGVSELPLNSDDEKVQKIVALLDGIDNYLDPEPFASLMADLRAALDLPSSSDEDEILSAIRELSEDFGVYIIPLYAADLYDYE